MKKILIILIVSVVAIRMLLIPFFGDPLSKMCYYIKGNIYLNNKYDFETQIDKVEYDFKTSDYFLSANAPVYNSLGFRVYVEGNGFRTEFHDDLNLMKWNFDIKEKLSPEVLAVYPYADVYVGISRNMVDIYQAETHISEIPNYFDVKELSKGDIIVSIYLDSYYDSSQLNPAYKVYKTIFELVEPASIKIKYKNKTFNPPYNAGLLGNRTEFLQCATD